MPRPRRPGADEPKRRSRTGCKPCKARKVKCDETKPSCQNCQKQGDTCDYSLDLKWNGRQKRVIERPSHGTFSTKAGIHASTSVTQQMDGEYRGEGMFVAVPKTLQGDSFVLPPQNVADGPKTPISSNASMSRLLAPTPRRTTSDISLIDPALTNGLDSADKHSELHASATTSNTNGRSGFDNAAGNSTGAHRNAIPFDTSGIAFNEGSRQTGHSTFESVKPDTAESYTRSSTRLSVSSLLSGPPGISSPSDLSSQYQDAYFDTTTWGIDRGFQDSDIGKNDDFNAISGSSPNIKRDHFDVVLENQGRTTPTEFGFGMETSSTAFDSRNYYAKPVPINIPRSLEPLPSILLENPMNLLYFEHHFLNHTAGCLIPHKCSSNPFQRILPQMAVQDDNLLNLLLAYSASHRARLLRHPEPATRIAMYVKDIFPNLRRALDDPNEVISNSTLATATMLASLEIISPTAFGIEIPWQSHLGTAREIIAARGGPQNMRSAALNDRVVDFLWSWFAYLDVLGSLSGGKSNAAWFFDYEFREENEYAIDCILGFTSRCVRLLAKVAEISRVCDSERIGPNLELRPDWTPSADTLARAKSLEAELAESRLHPIRPCTHMQSTGEAAYQWDTVEMGATNEAFHWAGLVHLHRRILGKPSTHPDVQQRVREIFGALYKVRKGSSADVCLLFPMFTAGCETRDERQRAEILGRMLRMEKFGMTQVHKARTLMERVWECGKPWETLVTGEFFG